jgi:hypothetical protein
MTKHSAVMPDFFTVSSPFLSLSLTSVVTDFVCFLFLAENICFRCLGIPLEIIMPAEIHIVILHVMTL